MPGFVVANYVLPLAVLLSGASATATAGLAWQLYRTINTHDRALFGEPEVDGHDGIVTAVNENTQMTDKHRRVLMRHDLLAAEARDGEQSEMEDT